MNLITAALVFGSSFHVFGNHYTELSYTNDGTTASFDLSGWVLNRIAHEDVFGIKLTFPASSCTARPDDPQIVSCQTKAGEYTAELRKFDGAVLPADTLGKIYWATLGTVKKRARGVDPATDWDEFHFSVNVSADKIPGIIMYLDDQAEQGPN